VQGREELSKSLQKADEHNYAGPWTWMKSLEEPRQQKMDMGFGMWNIRNMYRVGSLKIASK
jgi:hypothetical protein